MTRLICQSGDARGQVLELGAGRTLLGREDACDISVESPEVSQHHCEIVEENGRLLLRDLNSSNGTFVDGQPIKECVLQPGQILRVGEVEFLVVADDTPCAIRTPESCPAHPDRAVLFRCTQCGQAMCSLCVHVLKVHGGHGRFLCPHCSAPCEPIEVSDPRAQDQMAADLVMVRNLFAPRPHRPTSPPLK